MLHEEPLYSQESLFGVPYSQMMQIVSIFLKYVVLKPPLILKIKQLIYFLRKFARRVIPGNDDVNSPRT